MMKTPALMRLLIVIAILTGCNNFRELVDEAGVWTHIEIDWSKANLTGRNGASVWFFPHSGGKPVVLTTQSDSDSLRLRPGMYSVLVFNETINDHDYISFRGTDRYETFEAYAKPITINKPYSKDGNEPAAAAPNILAIDRIERLSVSSQGMGHDQRPLSLHFTPCRVVALQTIVVHINSLDNVGNSGSAASLSGMAEGINLATGRTTSTSVIHYAALGNKSFHPQSDTDGTMTARLHAFGLTNTPLRVGTERNRLTLYFRMRGKLPSGSYYLDPIVFDVTDQMQPETETNPEVQVTVQVTVPVVPPESGSDSGFDADVSDWGEETVTDIPI